VLQRTHLVTGDDAHYVAMVQELEAMGARVIPVFAGGLDSKPVDAYFYERGAGSQSRVGSRLSGLAFRVRVSWRCNHF